MKKFSFESAAELLREVSDLNYFHPNEDGETAIDMHVSTTDSQVVVVTGENASGKSFLRRLLSGVTRGAGHEIMHLSMEGRMDYMNSFGGLRSMVYGDEETRATGENSSRLIRAGLRNCADRAHKHVIIWDEPELGLSEGAQFGLGLELAEKLPRLPKSTLAAVLITHSKPMTRVLASLEPRPCFVYLGKPALSLDEWLAAPAAPRSLDDIEAEACRRFKLIATILNKKRKEQR